MAERPAHRRGPRRAGPAPTAAPTLPEDVRTGTRVLTLRVNRVSNAVVYGLLLLALLVLLFAAYRLTESGPRSGLVLALLAVVIAIWPIRRLGPGRLLTMAVTPTRVRLTRAFEADVVVERTAGLGAVLWVSRRYAGGEPRLRALYLVDGETVLAASRAATFSTERLQRFCANVALPVRLVDAERAPYVVDRDVAGARAT